METRGGGVFSVKSCYCLLEKMRVIEKEVSREKQRVINYLWKSSAPSKVLAFSWMVLLDCIPTQTNLEKRRVLDVNASKYCILCSCHEESSSHLFLHCEWTSKVWLKVFNWLQLHFITPFNLYVHMDCLSNEVTSKKLRKGYWLIWYATIWVLWKERNT